MAITLAGGLANGFSQYMMKESFQLDPADSGPLCAVFTSDVLLVSVFCHYVYHERLSMTQVAAILAIVGGLCVMVAEEYDVEPSSEFDPLRAYIYAIFGMVGFAAAIISIREGCRNGLDAWSGFNARMLVLLGLGIFAVAKSVSVHGWPEATLMDLAPAVAAGFLQAAAVVCVNKALEFASTGISNAIFACNSVLVLVLNAVVCGLVPNASNLLGMFIVICGVAVISSEEPDDGAGLLELSAKPGVELRTPLATV
jgi:drug/metabolite transporter (DMT)-like permease